MYSHGASSWSGIEPAGGLPRIDERGLDDVGSSAGIAEDRQRHRVHGAAEPLVDIAEHGVVRGREADRQIPVAHGHGSDDSTPVSRCVDALLGRRRFSLVGYGARMSTSDDDLETTWSDSDSRVR